MKKGLLALFAMLLTIGIACGSGFLMSQYIPVSTEQSEEEIEAQASGNWFDYVDDNYDSYSGLGITSDGYIWIDSALDLAVVMHRINDGGWTLSGKDYDDYDIRLGCDIDLREKFWSGIGTNKHPFSETFDGNGYKVSVTLDMDKDAYKKESNEYCAGFFSYTENAEIKNLTCRVQTNWSSTSSLDNNDGINLGMVGKSSGNLSITNCKAEGWLEAGLNTFDWHHIGGFVGKASGYTTISDCTNYCSVGLLSSIEIDECSSYNYVGGFVGYFMSSGYIRRSTNRAVVRLLGYTDMTGLCTYGGFIGTAGNSINLGLSISLDDCINYAQVCGDCGDVVGAQSVVGGILGRGYGRNITVRNCHNYCDDLYDSGGSGLARFGGIVGMSYDCNMTVSNCTNFSDFVIDRSVSHNVSYVYDEEEGYGGIVGLGYGYSSGSFLLIQDCANYGDIIIKKNSSGNIEVKYVGGILGAMNDNGLINRCINHGHIDVSENVIGIAVGGIAGGIGGLGSGSMVVGVFNCINMAKNIYIVYYTGDISIGSLVGRMEKSGNCFGSNYVRRDANISHMIGYTGSGGSYSWSDSNLKKYYSDFTGYNITYRSWTSTTFDGHSVSGYTFSSSVSTTATEGKWLTSSGVVYNYYEDSDTLSSKGMSSSNTIPVPMAATAKGVLNVVWSKRGSNYTEDLYDIFSAKIFTQSADSSATQEFAYLRGADNNKFIKITKKLPSNFNLSLSAVSEVKYTDLTKTPVEIGVENYFPTTSYSSTIGYYALNINLTFEAKSYSRSSITREYYLDSESTTFNKGSATLSSTYTSLMFNDDLTLNVSVPVGYYLYAVRGTPLAGSPTNYIYTDDVLGNRKITYDYHYETTLKFIYKKVNYTIDIDIELYDAEGDYYSGAEKTVTNKTIDSTIDFFTEFEQIFEHGYRFLLYYDDEAITSASYNPNYTATMSSILAVVNDNTINRFSLVLKVEALTFEMEFKGKTNSFKDLSTFANGNANIECDYLSFSVDTVNLGFFVKPDNGYYLRTLNLFDKSTWGTLNLNAGYNGSIFGQDLSNSDISTEINGRNVVTTGRDIINTFVDGYVGFGFGAGYQGIASLTNGTGLIAKIPIIAYYMLGQFDFTGKIYIDDVEIPNALQVSMKSTENYGATGYKTKTFASTKLYYRTPTIITITITDDYAFDGYYLIGTTKLLCANTTYTFENATSDGSIEIKVSVYRYASQEVEPPKNNGAYIVSEARHLIWIGEQVTLRKNTFDGQRFIQTKNIDVSSIFFRPIGTDQYPFKGSYEGNGFCIIGLGNGWKQSMKHMGLFGVVENAIVRNVNFVEGNIKGFEHIGALAGEARNSTFEYINNSDCNLGLDSMLTYDVAGDVTETKVSFVEATVSAVSSEIDRSSCIGGLVGKATNCTFYACSNRASIGNAAFLRDNDPNYVSGLVGYATSSSFDNCFNEGLICEKNTFTDTGLSDLVAGSGITYRNCYSSLRARTNGLHFAIYNATSTSGTAVSGTKTNTSNAYYDQLDKTIWVLVNGKTTLRVFYWY
ncbi:MAG: hypothetical protein E7375_01095 [Clostridiales bacterium]|nr:hypothetical protein [Clostridiales bacterium]